MFLGPQPCVVMMSSDVIREAFITKGHHYDGRMELASRKLAPSSVVLRSVRVLVHCSVVLRSVHVLVHCSVGLRSVRVLVHC